MSHQPFSISPAFRYPGRRWSSWKTGTTTMRRRSQHLQSYIYIYYIYIFILGAAFSRIYARPQLTLLWALRKKLYTGSSICQWIDVHVLDSGFGWSFISDAFRFFNSAGSHSYGAWRWTDLGAFFGAIHKAMLTPVFHHHKYIMSTPDFAKPWFIN